MSLKSELNRQKTFGIISHPDAGKTTLLEKQLLYGCAIQRNRNVKNNKINKGATSDLTGIERRRGISVATSLLALEYKHFKTNLFRHI